MKNSEHYLQIVGLGPGGLATPVAADAQGSLDELLRKGVAFCDARSLEEACDLGSYIHTSNSPGAEFVTGVSRDGLLGPVRTLSAAQQLEALGNRNVHLALPGEFLLDVRRQLAAVVSDFPQSSILENTRIGRFVVRDTASGQTFVSQVHDRGKFEDVAVSRAVVLATGADGNQPDLGENNDRVIPVIDILTGRGLPELRRRIEAGTSRRVAIVGGSHSAFIAAWILRRQCRDLSVGVFSLAEPRLFFDTVEEAKAYKYPVGEDDVCPETLRVHRFGGIRDNARAEFLRSRQSGDRPDERGNRTTFNLLSSRDSVRVAGSIGNPDVVIPATGFHARVIDICRADGTRIGPQVNKRGHVVVDEHCRVIGDNGRIIPGAYAAGICHSPVPSEALGGEPRHRRNGQTIEAANVFFGISGPRIVQQLLPN